MHMSFSVPFQRGLFMTGWRLLNMGKLPPLFHSPSVSSLTTPYQTSDSLSVQHSVYGNTVERDFCGGCAWSILKAYQMWRVYVCVYKHFESTRLCVVLDWSVPAFLLNQIHPRGGRLKIKRRKDGWNKVWCLLSPLLRRWETRDIFSHNRDRDWRSNQSHSERDK